MKLKDIGFPFEWLALRYGLTPTEVANVVAMREREAEMDPIAAATQVLAQRGPRDVEDEDVAEDEDAEEGALV